MDWPVILCFALVTTAADGCGASVPYRPVIPAQRAARVLAVRADKGAGTAQLSVYGFDRGCPSLDGFSASAGYRGTVPLVRGGEFQLPGGEQVALRMTWEASLTACTSTLLVRPGAGDTYGYVYETPEGDGGRCAAQVVRLVQTADGKRAPKAIAPVVQVPWRDTRSTQDLQQAAFCALPPLAMATDVPETPATTQAPAVESPPPAPPVRASETGTPAGSGGAGLPQPVPPDWPVSSPASVTTKVATVPAALPVQPLPVPVPSDHVSGSAVYLGVGLTLGGEDLASASNDQGDTETLTAGGGVALNIGLRLTPLWLKKRIGFGAGADIGLKYDSLGASNGHVSLLRFPFVAAAHVLMKGDDRWYFLLRGGIHKETGAHLSAEGSLQGDVDLASPLGGMGEVGGYYVTSPKVAVDFALRVTVVKYRVGNNEIGATNGGLFTGVHLMF